MTEGPAAEMAGPLLSAPQLRLVQQILAQHLPGQRVRVFGSRAHGQRLKPWSDLDLALLDEPAPTLAQAAALAQAFDDSDLPFRVDLLAWADAPPALRERIARDGVDLPASDATR